ncbi:hypothetical protein NLI96_g3789 [Meripilus lineatus]|uniref:Zn(2)-C6 fungal-type domain-containing protein n=1 Tax=Meripilus lineatus TaxID=2056292 RepID=A0AAD5YFD9_9APHY|nr:hypothetical protein NLI96_g3789 [Physisporinus lineatus]
MLASFASAHGIAWYRKVPEPMGLGDSAVSDWSWTQLTDSLISTFQRSPPQPAYPSPPSQSAHCNAQQQSAPTSNMKTDTPLQRGKACLCCRKRKMRCDGARPICSQCIKANRESECQYHEKKQISRTQMLQQKVVKLEARLRELEAEQSDSSGSSPAPSSGASSSADHSATYGVDASVLSSSPATWEASLFEDAVFPIFPTASSSSSTFLPAPVLSDLASAPEFLDAPLYFGSPFSTSHTATADGEVAGSPSSTPMNWWETSVFCQNKQTLLEIFFMHRHQCAFDVPIEEFQASLLLPTPDNQPHPALMDAIYLLGCYFSRSGDTSKLEKIFLARTLCGIPDAMQHSDRVIDVLRASCLLAVYFFATGRVLEGYYHSSIAARLSVSLGLHQIKADHWYSPQLQGSSSYPQVPSTPPKSSIQLAPPKDIAEFEQRKAAFQQIFTVDRAWSVATGLPSAIPDDSDTQAQIDRVWATSLNPYSIQFNVASTPRLNPVTPYPTFRAQAVKLFEKSFRLASISPNMKSDTYWMDHHRLNLSLMQFSSSLPRIGVFGGQNPLTLAEVDLLTVHTMVHVSTIHLHRELSQTNQDSYSKCLTAANIVTSLIRELGEECYAYLDPISSTCWTYVADVYVRAMACASPMQTLPSTFEFLNDELEVLLTAMKKISKVFPIASKTGTSFT